MLPLPLVTMPLVTRRFTANDSLGLNEEEERPIKINIIDPKQHELTRTFDVVLNVRPL